MTDSAYSFSLTTFSPNGKLVQIEHALQTVTKGDWALGIKVKNGVVLATEKRVPSQLMDETTFKKIENICAGVRPNLIIIFSYSYKIWYWFIPFHFF